MTDTQPAPNPFPPTSNPLKNPAAMALIKSVVAGQLRHVLSGIGGAGLLAAFAIPGQDTQNQVIELVVSGIFYAAGSAWSWWSKTGRDQFIARIAKLRFDQEERARKAAQDAADHRQANAIVNAVLAPAVSATGGQGGGSGPAPA
jgi:hypothetical protein